MYRDFGTSLLFILIGVLFLVVALALQRILSPQRKTFDKLTTYECGEDVEGVAWIRFNVRFYVVALIFIIFDVEVVFLFPWAVVYKELGLFAFVEMMIFLGILAVGLAYVWRKGDLDWVKFTVPYGSGRYRKLRVIKGPSPGPEEGVSAPTSPAGAELPAP
ncbi:MAG: NADH-quinone oxidoreductase subunit A [Fidelibacterota bacterium]